MSNVEMTSNKSFVKMERIKSILEKTLTNNPATYTSGERWPNKLWIYKITINNENILY